MQTIDRSRMDSFARHQQTKATITLCAEAHPWVPPAATPTRVFLAHPVASAFLERPVPNGAVDKPVQPGRLPRVGVRWLVNVLAVPWRWTASASVS